MKTTITNSRISISLLTILFALGLSLTTQAQKLSVQDAPVGINTTLPASNGLDIDRIIEQVQIMQPELTAKLERT